MSRAIDRDSQRFKKIVRGKIRGDLKKYVTQGEMLGRKGRETVSIPVPNVQIPHFRHGKRGSGGVGQGEGEEGQPIGRGGRPGDGDGPGTAGNEPGRHIREVEISIEELAEMLGEALQLPNIKPKGKDEISSTKDRYNSVRRTGPDSLRHVKRTYKRALKRSIAAGEFDPKNPVVIPVRDDEEYRSWTTRPEPQANAAVIYMMDVSGSMTDEQKGIVRTEAFWIDTWLKRQYGGLQRRYVVHDAVAHEVDEDTFYRTRESGGTRISSALFRLRKNHRPGLPPRGVERLRLPVLRRGQLGRGQRRLPRETHRRHPPALQPVLLRAGGKPLRQRRLHPRTAAGRGGARTIDPQRDREPRGDLRFHQRLPGDGAMSVLTEEDRALERELDLAPPLPGMPPPGTVVNGDVFVPKGYEFVAGDLIRKHMSVISSWVAGETFGRVRRHVQEAGLPYFTFPENTSYRCFPAPGDRLRSRRADTSAVRTDRLPGGLTDDAHIPVRPDFAVEVISPSDKSYDTERKLADYDAAAIPLVWVVHPVRRTVRVIDRDAGTDVTLREGDTLTGGTVLPNFTLPVADIFPPAAPAAADGANRN